MELKALVAPLRADVVSGAAVIGRTASEVVCRAVSRFPVESSEELRQILAALCMEILEAQPAMAPLVAMASEALRSFDSGEELEAARAKVLTRMESFRRRLEEGAESVAQEAKPFLPPRGRVLTHSDSSTVRSTLARLGPELGLQVTCLEARPMSEGKAMARYLARAGLPVTFAVDASGCSLVREVDLLLLGADSVGDQGVVNKVGSYALALSAQDLGKPVYVLVDETKLLPPGFPQVLGDDRPEEEVWRAPSGVRVWNRYFEAVPLELITNVITETAPHSPEGLLTTRRQIPVPRELSAWAASRLP